MDLEIQGRVAVITGGDSGIGLATAKVLAEEGCHVALTDKHLREVEEAAERVKAGAATGVKVIAIDADLTQHGSADRLAETVRGRLGPAHMLAHFAGARGASGDFLELSDEDWVETIAIDLLGAVRICRAFLPQMLEHRWGRILLTGSENGVQPYPEESPYNACKAAVVNLAKGLSKEYSGKGVLVNVISPAFIDTPMTDAMLQELAEVRGASIEETEQWFLKYKRPGVTLGRRGRPEEVAVVAALMLSPRASFVNGCNWRVDGGSVHSAFG